MVTEDKYVGSIKSVDTDSKERRSTRREVDEKEIKQLNELVELAETVSSNIDRLARLRDFCAVGAFVVFSVLFYFVAKSPSIITTHIYLIIPATISIFGMIRSAIEMNKKIKLESLILRDLLNTIHPFKEGVFRDTGQHIYKAIFRMKLSRIKFSNIEDPKEKASIKKEQPTSIPKTATTP